MGKIKGWTKRIDSRMESEWVNDLTNYKVRITKFKLWEFRVYDNEGQYANPKFNRNNLSKEDATRLALKYMRANLNG